MDTPALVERAKKRMAQGDRDGAIIDLKTAVQQSPADGEVRYLLGRLYNETIDKPSAEKELIKAKELGVVDGGALLVELARAYQHQNKWTELLKDVVPSDAFETTRIASMHALRGQAFVATGAIAKAKESLAAASAAAPDEPDVVLLAARMDLVGGNRQLARERITALVAKHPGHFEALMYLAGLSLAEGKVDETLKIYNEMLRIQPYHYGLLTNRSTILIMQRQLDAAQRDVDVMRKVYKGAPTVLVQQGLLHLERGKPRDALGSAEAVLKIDKTDVRALLLAGLAHASMRSYEQAERALVGYLERSPGDLFATVALARVQVLRGAGTRALELLSHLAQRDIREPEFWLVLADAHAAAGDQKKALAFYEKVVQLDPDSTLANVKLGMSLITQGRTEAATSVLAQAIERGKEASNLDEIAVMAMLARGQVDKSASAVKTLVERSPKSALAHNLSGLVLQEQRKLDEARVAFERAARLDPAFLPAVRNLAALDIAEGKLVEARNRYASFNERNKNNLDAMMAQAELELSLGNPDAGMQLFKAAASARPDAIEPRARLAVLYLARNAVHEANAIAEEALAANPDRFEAMLLAAEMRLADNKWGGAIQVLQRLARDAPQSAHAQMLLGRAFSLAGRTTEAEAAFRKALEVNPRLTSAQIGLVSLMTAGKRWDDALQFARSLQKAEPKGSTGIIMEAEIAEARGDLGKAAREYERAMKVQPGSHALLKLYQTRKMLGESASAQALLDDWIKRNPGDRVVRVTLAEDLAVTGKLKLAIEHFELLTRNKEADFRAWNGLAWSYGEIGDERALPAAEIAFKIEPNSPMVKDTLGWLLVGRGDVKRGLKLLKEAAEAKPDSPDVRFHLGVAYAKAGDTQAARTELQHVIDRHHGSPQSNRARSFLATLPAR